MEGPWYQDVVNYVMSSRLPEVAINVGVALTGYAFYFAARKIGSIARKDNEQSRLEKDVQGEQ